MDGSVPQGVCNGRRGHARGATRVGLVIRALGSLAVLSALFWGTCRTAFAAARGADAAVAPTPGARGSCLGGLQPALAPSSSRGPSPLLRGRRRRLSARGLAGRTRRSAGEVQSLGAEKRIFLIGGTGRVGASTLRWVLRMGAEEGLRLSVVVAGRSEENFEQSMDRLRSVFGVRATTLAEQVSFRQVDYNDASALEAAISSSDLVIHTAGPFQQKEDNEVLRASLRQRVPYIDVCDATNLISLAKREMGEEAKRLGVPVIVSTGIWPGVSALMAKHVMTSLGGQCSDLEMSFYTAGTGGAGITILSATFLLLAEPSLWIQNGKQDYLDAWTVQNRVDFGGDVGERNVFNLDEPEVFMIHDACGVPNVRSSFGTSPEIWNALFGFLRFVPASILANRDLMQKFAAFSLPIVRAVDTLVGSTNAMRVDGRSADGAASFLCVHPDLESAVGIGAASFAMEVLLGNVPPGVHYPVELDEKIADAILERARVESTAFDFKKE